VHGDLERLGGRGRVSADPHDLFRRHGASTAVQIGQVGSEIDHPLGRLAQLGLDGQPLQRLLGAVGGEPRITGGLPARGGICHRRHDAIFCLSDRRCR